MHRLGSRLQFGISDLVSTQVLARFPLDRTHDIPPL